MAATSYTVISCEIPNFIVEYKSGDKTKRVKYNTYMLPKEIEAQMPFIEFEQVEVTKPKIWVKRTSKPTGSTLGAFLYTYLIAYDEDGYYYDYQMSEEGFMTITKPFEVVFVKNF